jgi:hypothetical protein
MTIQSYVSDRIAPGPFGSLGDSCLRSDFRLNWCRTMLRACLIRPPILPHQHDLGAYHAPPDALSAPFRSHHTIQSP